MRKGFYRYAKYYAVILSLGMIIGLSGCGSSGSSEDDYDIEFEEEEEDEDEDYADEDIDEEWDESEDVDYMDMDVPTKDTITVSETKESSADGEHAITADGETLEFTDIKVTKSGDADGDEADFYGENAAVFATNGATLNLTHLILESNGTHANGVFSYGEGTTVNVSDSVIETSGNCSGGLMTTGGGTMNATNLNIHTTGNSSAAIRSDRGGGTVTVEGGSYVTDGTGSPVIYSTADITVSDATLESTASEGVVVEGKNSVTLDCVELTADHSKLNSDKSENYNAVMIYQSMSGDADQGTATFTMSDSTLTNKKGDIFFVNNTQAVITLQNDEIINGDTDGLFLRAAAAGWGQEGSNGGNVTLKAGDQQIDGDILVDEVSTLNMYLTSESIFNGAINSDGQAGDVYVEITGESKWTLSADSYITSLTCSADSIDLNGHKLYVNGTEYKEGSESSGEAVEAKVSEGGEMQAPPDGNGPGNGEKPEGEPPAKPDGDTSGPGNGEKPEGEPPAKPDGDTSGPGNGEKPEGEPPEKPEGESSADSD